MPPVDEKEMHGFREEIKAAFDLHNEYRRKDWEEARDFRAEVRQYLQRFETAVADLRNDIAKGDEAVERRFIRTEEALSHRLEAIETTAAEDREKIHCCETQVAEMRANQKWLKWGIASALAIGTGGSTAEIIGWFASIGG